AGVEAELILDERALLRPTGNADSTAAGELRKLAHDLPYGARGCRDHDRVARFRLADLEEAEIGREPRHAENAVRSRDRRHRRVDLPRAAAADTIFLPADPLFDDVADLVVRIVRLHDLADDTPRHDLADLNNRRIGNDVPHAPAHVGVEREIDGAD